MPDVDGRFVGLNWNAVGALADRNERSSGRASITCIIETGFCLIFAVILGV
jgi:hypothetical protein